VVGITFLNKDKVPFLCPSLETVAKKSCSDDSSLEHALTSHTKFLTLQAGEPKKLKDLKI
jgi:hypothetical protein